MAWIFSLSAECGSNKHQAELFAKHFDGLSFGLITGKSSTCHSNVQKGHEGNWWAVVCPDNISRSGNSTLDDAIDFSELGFRLYKRLMSAPSFRFALVGCEVDEFRSYSELLDDVGTYSDGHRELTYFDGLVLREDVWKELGMPLGFLPFSEEHRWKPYWGTSYSPLGDNKEYSKRLRDLQKEIPSLKPEGDT
jgi:hypothetical protein